MHLTYQAKAAIGAAREAGAIMLRREKKRSEYTYKGAHDILSATDLACEKAIIGALRRKFPAHGILSEEAGKLSTQGAEHVWVIDPLDGTANFSQGLDEYCTSIALMRGDDILVGVVYQPKTDRLFVAQRGRGAFLNGERIRVSGKAKLSDAMAATDQSHRAHVARRNLASLSRLSPKVRDVRILGSAALHLCRLAQGQIDVYFKHSFNLWDYAAGALIVAEAGGTVTDMRAAPIGRASKDIVATNGQLHKAALALLKG